MTHPTDDHLRQRTQNETRWCGRCYRESVACICATRPNALAAAPQPTISSIRNEISNLSVWSGKVHDEQQLVDLAHVLAILDAAQQEPTP